MKQHYAVLSKSDRLKKLLKCLSDRKWHSTLELMKRTSLCAIGSAMSELRANNIEIETRCVGQGKYEYRRCKC